MSDSEEEMTQEQWEILDGFVRLMLSRDAGDFVEKRKIVDQFQADYPELANRFENFVKSGGMAPPSSQSSSQNENSGSGLASQLTFSGESNTIGEQWLEEIPDRLDDYLLLNEIGRGGMGIVFQAEQLSLGRKVAVKILPRRDPRSVAMFKQEARATAQLAHTNVVSIFGITQAGDLHYIVMQFIDGEDLSRIRKAIRDRGKESNGKSKSQPSGIPGGIVGGLSSPSSRPKAAANIGIQVANALEFFHRNDFGHRDIKPSNLLVQGDLVRVADFGVAWLAPTSPEQDPVGLKEDDSLAEITWDEAGGWPGTPRYKPPECQPRRLASEEADRAPSRSPFLHDIYSLGLTLYEISTLEIPFHGFKDEQLVDQILKGNLRRPRDIDPRIPRDLEAIILKAIARNPAERYRNAIDFREDLEHFLAGKPVAARPINPIQTLYKLCRRRPAEAATTLISVFLFIFVGLVAGNYYREAHDHAIRVDQALVALRTSLDRGRGANPFDPIPWREARESAERSKAILTPLDSRSVEELNQAGREARQGEKSANFLQALASVRGAEFNDPDGIATDEKYQSLFDDFGLNVDVLSDEPLHDLVRFLPPASIVELTAALDDWARVRRWRKQPTLSWQKPLLLAKILDSDPYRGRIRDLSLAENVGPEQLHELKELAVKVLADDQPSQNILLLARSLGKFGDLQAEETLLRKTLLKRPDDLWINHEMAVCLFKTENRERTDEAIRFFSVTRALRPQVAFDLAQALTAQGRLEEASSVYADLIRFFPNDGSLYCAMGLSLKAQGRHSEAGAAFARAMQELEVEILKYPNHAQAHNSLGVVLHNLDRLKEAITQYREAIRLAPDHAEAHSNLGVALYDSGKNLVEAAENECRLAIRLRPGTASFHNHLGIVLGGQNRHVDAIEEYREAIRLRPDSAEAHTNLARSLEALGRRDEAEAEFREAIRVNPALAAAHNNLGTWLLTVDRKEVAEKEFREAVRLQPNNADAHSNLGHCLHALGFARLKNSQALRDESQAQRALAAINEAVKECREAKRLRPGSPEIRCTLAEVLLGLDLKEAIEAEIECREAIRLSPDYAEAHFNLALALRKQGKLDEAAAACREAIRIRDDFAVAHCILGRILQNLERYNDGLTALKRGHELCTKQGKRAVPSAEWLREIERLVNLESLIPALRSGQNPSIKPEDQVILASLCLNKKLYTLASRCFADAIDSLMEQANDPSSALRYNGACASALAACGQGEDAPTLGDPARARLREQALGWLDADLTNWENRLNIDPDSGHIAIYQTITHWMNDSDLAGIRDSPELNQLPKVEREKWEALWLRVEKLKSQSANPLKH